MEVRDLLLQDGTYRIRSMSSLKVQLINDYDRLNQLLKKIENSVASFSEIKEARRLLSWLKTGLGLFYELNEKDIEGVISGRAMDIEKNLSRLYTGLLIHERSGSMGEKSI